MARFRHSHPRLAVWASLAVAVALLTPSLVEAKGLRHLRRGVSQLGKKFYEQGISLTMKGLELPPRAQSVLTFGAKQVNRAREKAMTGLKDATYAGQLREFRDAMGTGDYAGASRGLTLLEEDLRQKLSQGKWLTAVLAALRLARAERILRHAAEDAIQRGGATSFGVFEQIRGNLVPGCKRWRSNSPAELEAHCEQRSEQTRAQQGALEFYKRVVRERRIGQRFDPWEGPHARRALTVVRFLHRLSQYTGRSSIDGFRMPGDRRILGNADYLAKEGYAKMVEIADELLDIMLLDRDPQYAGPSAKTQAKRKARLELAHVKEIARTADNAESLMTKLHEDPEEEEKKEGDLSLPPAPEGALRADVADVLSDRLSERVKAGDFHLTDSLRRELRLAKRDLRRARRREMRPVLASAAHVGHNTLAALLRGKDWVGYKFKEGWKEVLSDTVELAELAEVFRKRAQALAAQQHRMQQTTFSP